ncbi:MAG: VOC family protein [Pseudomonadota bacterium]
MNRRSLLALGAAATTFHAIALPAAQAATPGVGGLRFDHISLNVRDFDGMTLWYREVLGFEVEVAWSVAALDGKRLAYLRLADTVLELVEADADGAGLPAPATFREHFARTGYGHLCFAVESVDRVLDALEAAGVPSFVEAATYALDGTVYTRRVGFVQDPEGNVLEFAEPLREA